MGKKAFIAAFIISAFLVSMVAGVKPVELAKAYPAPTPTPTPTPNPTPTSTPNLTSTPTPTPTSAPTQSSGPNSLTPTSTPTPTPASSTSTPSYPKPLVPEFTAKVIVSITEANKTTIVLTIRNQPFDNNNSYHYSFVYNVRARTDDGNWTVFYSPEDGYPSQSNSDYTTLSYVVVNSSYYPGFTELSYSLGDSGYLNYSPIIGLLPSDGDVDFQVEAMIGNRGRGFNPNATNQLEMFAYVFYGETSDWSNTQAITIPDNASTPSPSPSATQKPTFSILYPLSNSFFNVSLGGVHYQLIYETNSSLSWVGYSLDGASNVTVTGNSTFVHEFVSSNRYHTVTVYANDTSGNWATPQTVTYLVNFYPDYPPSSLPSPSPTQQPTTEPKKSPTPTEGPFIDFPVSTLSIELSAIVLVAAAVLVGVLVYFKKHRK